MFRKNSNFKRIPISNSDPDSDLIASSSNLSIVAPCSTHFFRSSSALPLSALICSSNLSVQELLGARGAVLFEGLILLQEQYITLADGPMVVKVIAETSSVAGAIFTWV